MIYNLLFGIYENIVNKVKNKINTYFEDKPQRSLVEEKCFLLTEHVSFFIGGFYLFYGEHWLWDITQMWVSSLNLSIIMYYYLYIARYVVQIKMLSDKEKDYNTSLVHHISTISLLVVSFYRYHRIGIIIGIIHDISDIFLLSAKIFHNSYEVCKKEYMNLMSNVFFSIFIVSFVVTRIFLNGYIIKYIIETEISPRDSLLDFYNSSELGIDGHISFNLLFINLSLQIFWQVMICKFIYKLIIGEPTEDEKGNTYHHKKK